MEEEEEEEDCEGGRRATFKMSRRRRRRRNLFAGCIRFAEKNGMTCMSTTTAPAGYLDKFGPSTHRESEEGTLRSFF